MPKQETQQEETKEQTAPAAGEEMRTVNHQFDPPPRGRERFKYKEDRHYVLVEAPSQNWDGDVLDRLLDMIDPETGDFAYVIEARGEENGKAGEGRRITGHRHKVLLSCSKSYADRMAQQYATDSSMVAKAVNKAETPISATVNGQRVSAVMTEQLDHQPHVPLRGIIGA